MKVQTDSSLRIMKTIVFNFILESKSNILHISKLK